MQRNYWKRKILVFSFISIESLLFIVGMTKPAFSSYFAFSREYKSGFKQIQLSGQFKARDRDRNGEISATEIEDFEGIILYRHQKQPEAVSLLDSIDFKERLEFERFRYNLATNHLEFSIRTRNNKIKSLTDPTYSHWQVNFQKELDNFSTNQNSIVGIDSEGTGTTQISRNTLSERESLIILLILGLILFRINQQIQTKSQINQELKELNLPNTWSQKNIH